MKLAVLSESAADEAAIRILVTGILNKQTQPIEGPQLKTRGWPSVREVLPSVLKHLHYQTDAESFVLVVDSDFSPMHEIGHEEPGRAEKDCRFCSLHDVINQVQSVLRPVPGRGRIKIAIGLAVPAIEAWYRCRLDPHVSEASWISGLRSGSYPYSKNELKRAVYGTDRPSLDLETKFAVQEARGLVKELDQLVRSFTNRPIYLTQPASTGSGWDCISIQPTQSASRGKSFYRLAQQAVQVDPAPIA